MGRHTTGAMAIAILLTACQGPAPTRPDLANKAASPAPPRTKATPSAGAGAATLATAPALLAPPSRPSVKLSGQVALDAAYATRFGGATTLIGMDGASLIGMDGASLAGADGRSLVAGGRVIAAPDGNVAVPAAVLGTDGAMLIGMDGATLVGGAPLVGPDGASLVGPDGASMVAAGAGNLMLLAAGTQAYGLRQAPPASAVPAAGMWVSVVDMRTGFTVPLGVADGREVHTVYSDAAGRFEVHLDPTIAADVRIVARAPGRRDPRLALTVITDPAQASQRIDERAALATDFMRAILSMRMIDLFDLDTAQAAKDADRIAQTGQVNGASEQLLQVLGSESMRAMRAALDKIGIKNLSASQREALALLIADRTLAEMKLDEITLQLNGFEPDDPEAKALVGQPLQPVLRGHFEAVVAAAERKLAGEADPAAWLASRPWLIEANLRRAPEARYRLSGPVDVASFMVREYLASNDSDQNNKVATLFHDLGLPARERDLIRIVGESFMVAILTAMVASANEAGKPTSELIAEVIETTGARIASAPPLPLAVLTGPGALPVPTVPPAPALGPVETVAGLARTRGDADGVGDQARFNAPSGLVVVPGSDPPVLYVADSESHLIREVRFDAQGVASVKTLAGLAGAVGRVDGAGPAPRFGVPQGLALDAQGRIYVADSFNHAIRRLTPGPDGAWTTETLAGGQEGFADGPLATARFNLPRGLAIDAQGDVLVADTFNHRVRRLALSRGVAETLAGTGQPGLIDGPAAQARIGEPSDVEVAPDGSLYVSQQSPSVIRRILAPVGPAADVRLVAGAGSDQRDLDGFYTSSWFHYVQALALDPQGRLVVPDYGSHRLRLVTPEGWASTLAGGGPIKAQAGTHADGPGPDARFNAPAGVAVAADGTIFVADTRNHVIRRLRPR